MFAVIFLAKNCIHHILGVAIHFLLNSPLGSIHCDACSLSDEWAGCAIILVALFYPHCFLLGYLSGALATAALYHMTPYVWLPSEGFERGARKDVS